MGWILDVYHWPKIRVWIEGVDEKGDKCEDEDEDEGYAENYQFLL